jgi:hypothetical protein
MSWSFTLWAAFKNRRDQKFQRKVDAEIARRKEMAELFKNLALPGEPGWKGFPGWTTPPTPSKESDPNHPERSQKLVRCIRTIESDLLKRELLEAEEIKVAAVCNSLLGMALGEEALVIRLITFEWASADDIVTAVIRAEEKWRHDHTGSL